MQLRRLVALEVEKLEQELAELRARIAELEAILADRAKLMRLISAELAEIASEHGTRRTWGRGDVQVPCDASRSSRTRLRSTPQAYPESEPSLRTTRWQGMAMASLFAEHAAATARAAFGDPMRRASSA